MHRENKTHIVHPVYYMLSIIKHAREIKVHDGNSVVFTFDSRVKIGGKYLKIMIFQLGLTSIKKSLVARLQCSFSINDIDESHFHFDHQNNRLKSSIIIIFLEKMTQAVVGVTFLCHYHRHFRSRTRRSRGHIDCGRWLHHRTSSMGFTLTFLPEVIQIQTRKLLPV